MDSEQKEKTYWNLNQRHPVGVCCAVLGDCAYTFGGCWKYGYAVHEVSLETMTWRRLEPSNREDGPIQNNLRAGMIACGDNTLCVFGGLGHTLQKHQPGAAYHTYDPKNSHHCFTNELHLFSISTGMSKKHAGNTY